MTHRRRALLALVLAVAAYGALARAQKLPPGPQVLTFFSDVDDSEQPYGLYLPKNFDTGRKYPLVVMLHGAGSNHRLGMRRVFGRSNMQGENDIEATRVFPSWPDVDYIVVTVFARGTMGYQGIAEKDLWDAVADVKRRFPVDEDRTYLPGYSMGGGGTLWVGLTRPDVWAAIAPVCPAPPFRTVERAPNALNVPVMLFQGEADPLVSAEGTRQWVKRLQDGGAKVDYTEYPGVGHNSWENTYADNAIFKAFARHKRNRFPDRVRFVSDMYKYGNAYWVTFDKLTPGTFATIDAQFTAANRIEIATRDLGAFTLHLTGHPKFSRLRPVQISIDGATLSTVTTTGSVPLVRKEAGWVVGTAAPSETSKKAGLEGPIGDAITRRHVYVLGTLDKPSPEEGQQRRDITTRAATWMGTGPFAGRVAVYPRVITDAQVRPSDVSTSDFVVLGTKETNGLIATHADQLPMHLSATAAADGYGLLYVYPVNGHYMLVSSGVPWFPLSDPAPPAGRGGRGGPPDGPGGRGGGGANAAIPEGFDFVPPVQRALTKFPDFVLFKGTPANIVASGRFDDDWRLTASDLEKITAAGVVTVSAGARAGTAAAGGR